MRTTINPLYDLINTFPYDPDKVLATASGNAYVAIMLSNGQIGVCSTLNKPVTTDPLLLHKPDLDKEDHRMFSIAYINAHLNYQNDQLQTGDIFERIDFKNHHRTVMIGYFSPLVEKFQKDNLDLKIFDLFKVGPDITPAEELDTTLGEATCVILTSTALVNNTFPKILELVQEKAQVYLLGPSTPLNIDFKNHFHIDGLFGMIFNRYDFGVLEIIGSGLGTQVFGKKGKKVSL